MAETAIAELQEVFGTLLKVEREKPRTNNSNYSKPKWSGSFRLFDFPRELRDRIYYHYAYNPNGVVYCRSSRPDFITGVDNNHVALFLTCRQVYDEALQVFCRYNAVSIKFKGGLAGVLRIFPEKPGALLQRIQLVYSFYYWKSPWRRPGPSGAWAQMIVDAHVAKQYLPVLRECTASWTIDIWSLEREEKVRLQDKSGDERAAEFLKWMRFWYREDKLIPPPWMRVEFARPSERDLNLPFSQALAVFREEVKFDGQAEDLETSGQSWLEEMSEVSRKRTRKKAKNLKRGG